MILKPGYGYWDTTAYPIGGNFRRAPKSGKGIEFKVTEVMPKPFKGCNIKGEIISGADGKKLACDSNHCVRRGEGIKEMKKSELKALIRECLNESIRESKFKVGDYVHVGFKTPGGAGYSGKITRLIGNSQVEIEVGKDVSVPLGNSPKQPRKIIGQLKNTRKV